MIALIGGLRAEQPDLFVNLTTGTYPSPFFLRYADSIWRGGEDHDFAGVGSNRQRWITYRDADTYRGIVKQGPLFPLNALMLHGLIYARHAHNLDTDPQHDFASEIRAYFGTGTQLQEMYITPSLLSSDDCDTLAGLAVLALGCLLGAGCLHVPWNVVVRGGAARDVVAWWAVVGGSVLFVRVPLWGGRLPAAVWQLAVASAAVEAVYYVLLAYAYG